MCAFDVVPPWAVGMVSGFGGLALAVLGWHLGGVIASLFGKRCQPEGASEAAGALA